MGLDDRIDAKSDQAKGKIKEGIGDLTDDESLEAEGKTDQAKGKLKEGWEDAKDAVRDIKS